MPCVHDGLAEQLGGTHPPQLLPRPPEHVHCLFERGGGRVRFVARAKETLRRVLAQRHVEFWVVVGAQEQQVVGRHGHGLAREQREQALGAVGVCQHVEQRKAGPHLRRLEVARSPGDHHVEPPLAQGVGVPVGARGRSHQQDHVAGGMSGVAQLGEACGDVRGLASRGVLGAAQARPVGADGHLHARSASMPAASGGGGGKVQEILLEIALPPADLPHEGQDVGVAAEVRIELLAPRRHGGGRHHIGLVLQIHLDVGSLEAVDALLRIAHGAKVRARRAGDALDHVDLQLARVLELVDHYQAEAVGVLACQLGMLVEGSKRHADEVARVQQALLAQPVAVCGLHFAGEVQQLSQKRHALHHRERALGPLHGLLQLGHAGAFAGKAQLHALQARLHVFRGGPPV